VRVPDWLEVLDGSGEALVLHGPGHSGVRVRLHEGRSPGLRTTVDARTLVLHLGGEELERIPLELVPGQMIVIRGPAAAARPLGRSRLAGAELGAAQPAPALSGPKPPKPVTSPAPWQP